MGEHSNLLVIMVDQLSGSLFPDGPAPFLHTPNLRRLTQHSVRFKNCYTASPMAAPARIAALTGLRPSQSGVYDNGSEFSSQIPTFAHYLRGAGYFTSAIGQMDFVGADQLHGFDERLMPDNVPADFGAAAYFGHEAEGFAQNMKSGVDDLSTQFEYNDDVTLLATQKLYDFSRKTGGQPWCIAVSFAQLQEPFVARKKYWDIYDECPECENGDREDITRARQGYFANISYIDEKIGQLFAVLDETQQEATVIFLSNSAEMAKKSGLPLGGHLYENRLRVPLIIYAPQLPAKLIETPVTTRDLCQTICALAGVEHLDDFMGGVNLVPIIEGEIHPRIEIEYMGDCARGTIVALREGAWKYITSLHDEEFLFDLASDPEEDLNLIDDDRATAVLNYFRAMAEGIWDLGAIDTNVRVSHQRRQLIHSVTKNTGQYPWDYQSLRSTSERYIRNNMVMKIVSKRRLSA